MGKDRLELRIFGRHAEKPDRVAARELVGLGDWPLGWHRA
jgi:hypothetical protein